MATVDFVGLNEEDTKELRKELGLPVKKDIVYWYKEGRKWVSKKVIDYRVADKYMPSESYSLQIVTEDNVTVRILADYLVEMQKTDFVTDIEGEEVVAKTIRTGKRIEGKVIDYTVVDIETTGTNHNCDDIIEIGAVKYRNHLEVERYSVLLKTDKILTEKVKNLTGITNEMIEKEGIDSNEAITGLLTFLGDDIVVGHNFTRFDYHFLNDYCKKLLDIPFPNDFLDTLYISNKSLEVLSSEYEIDYSKAHRAVEDCVINHFVYEYLVYGIPAELNPNKAEEELSISEDDEGYSCEIDQADLVGWKKRLSDKLMDYISVNRLPENSLSIKANMDRNKTKITSYSVCISEPDLISSNHNRDTDKSLFRIEEKSNKNEVYLRVGLKDEILDILNCLNDISVKGGKEKYLSINPDSPSAESVLMHMVDYEVKHYSPKASTFACCSRYIECSDAKECIHPNRLYAMACQYRKNIENNRIFYGKNKNI